jgi:hypothetical protein
MQKTINLKTTLLLAGLLCFWLSSSAHATDRVVVIPMGGGTLKNIVTVAKANGKFTDPVAAVNSITDASATNPYLVLIAPGQYTLTATLVMKPYVDITGSGENVTLLTGAISSASPSPATSAIIKGVNHATLSNLSISNTGGNIYSIGIYTTGLGISARLQQVLATATGATLNFGVLNDTNSSPIMTDMNVIAGGGMVSVGIYNYTSSPPMTDLNIVVLGGTFNIGIYNDSSSSPIMTGVNTAVSGGTTNYGVYNIDSSAPTIRRSSLAGATDGLANDSATATISQSTILNGVSGGGYTCVACDNGAGGALTLTCL